MSSKNSTWKSCVTCQLWAGSRKLGTFRDRVEYGNGDKGECVGGGWNGAQKRAEDSCQEWEKWSLFK